jgi:hypothetical protein
MTDPTQDDWPTWLLGRREHYHALGVIAAAFNLLEHRFLGLFLLYVGFDERTAWLFRRLNDNALRSDILRRAVDDGGETPDIIDRVHRFRAGFAQCAENRNILMHSLTTTIQTEGRMDLIFNKANREKPLEPNRFIMDIAALRRVAEEMNVYSVFGKEIYGHVTWTYREEDLRGPTPIAPGGPLPDKPPLPEGLTPQEIPGLGA